MSPVAPELRSTTGRAVGAAQLAPTARYQTSVAIRPGRTAAVKTAIRAGRVAVETSPTRHTAPLVSLTPPTVSASPGAVGTVARTAPPAVRATARFVAAATVMGGIPLAASNVWTAVPLFVVLTLILILTPSEARRARSSRA